MTSKRPDKMNKKKPRHGGKRKGAGRKPSGREPYLIRMHPDTMAAITTAMKRRGHTMPGELLESIDWSNLPG